MSDLGKRSLALVTLCGLILTLCPELSLAAQRGPIFPTHRFPTDESFHLSFNSSYFTSNSNFVDTLSTEPLTDNANLRVLRQSVVVEFQPSRDISAGLILNLDSARVSDAVTALSVSRSRLSDQYLFFENRIIDRAGTSLGLGGTVKFPAYSNPTLPELQGTGAGSAVFLGDAQSDFSLLAMAEFWTNALIRVHFDTGFTYRLEGYGHEIPFQVAVGFVTPKLDFNLKVRGNFSLGNDSGTQTDVASLRAAAANSFYALAQNPWTIIINPTLELWMSNKWAIDFGYAHSLMGNNSAMFDEFTVGIRYRWAQRRDKTQKTFQQIDIKTDQEEGRFQTDDSKKEPKAFDSKPIIDLDETDEEFR